MLIFQDKFTEHHQQPVNLTVYLTAAERLKTQQRIDLPEFPPIYLRLPRGEILQPGDRLISQNRDIILLIMAKSEAVMTVTANNNLELLKAAYHLGNRHVPLEIQPDYLRFIEDSVLESMLVKLGLTVTRAIVPFYPEMGAYQQHHG
jgi:urease accessory protein